jgi:hypothetical protein
MNDVPPLTTVNRVKRVTKDMTVGRKRHRVKWTQEEVDKLVEGYREYGGKWAMIRDRYGFSNPQRTGNDLKDKIRWLKKTGVLPDDE